MTVHFMCNCGSKTYSLPDSMAGQEVRCPACQNIIIVPQASEGGQVVMAVPAGEAGEY